MPHHHACTHASTHARTAPHCTALHRAAPHRTARHCMTRYGTVLHASAHARMCRVGRQRSVTQHSRSAVLRRCCTTTWPSYSPSRTRLGSLTSKPHLSDPPSNPLTSKPLPAKPATCKPLPSNPPVRLSARAPARARRAQVIARQGSTNAYMHVNAHSCTHTRTQA